MSNTITVYWANGNFNENENEFIYNTPIQMFSELMNHKSKEADNSTFFSCPAMSRRFKNTYYFTNGMNNSFSYNFSEDGEKFLKSNNPSWINISKGRNDTLDIGPILRMDMQWFFFAEEPLYASFTPPYCK